MTVTDRLIVEAATRLLDCLQVADGELTRDDCSEAIGVVLDFLADKGYSDNCLEAIVLAAVMKRQGVEG